MSILTDIYCTIKYVQLMIKNLEKIKRFNRDWDELKPHINRIISPRQPSRGRKRRSTLKHITMPTHVGTEPITVVPSLDHIYPSVSLLRQGERWNSLVERFSQVYGENPDYIARAPGRVSKKLHISHEIFI